jgi:hypothetical protein
MSAAVLGMIPRVCKIGDNMKTLNKKKRILSKNYKLRSKVDTQ